MVHGLEHFKQFFEEYNDQYILIGGSACSVVFDSYGSNFRSTKDLDLVLVTEALTKDFVDRFWQYVKSGDYSYIRKKDGKRMFYRFEKPKKVEYPAMLEILTTRDILSNDEMIDIKRMSLEDECISLSAILLDAAYYEFIHACKISVYGISTISVKCLIPLKIKAWLNLREMKLNNSEVRSSEINKHKNDVIRLEAILSNKRAENIPRCVQADVQLFIKELQKEKVDLRSLGIKNRTLDEILEHLNNYYCYNS